MRNLDATSFAKAAKTVGLIGTAIDAVVIINEVIQAPSGVVEGAPAYLHLPFPRPALPPRRFLLVGDAPHNARCRDLQRPSAR